MCKWEDGISGITTLKCELNKKEPRAMRGSFVLRQGAGDGAEGVADPGAKQAYNTDDNKCHESEDDRILHQALTSLL